MIEHISGTVLPEYVIEKLVEVAPEGIGIRSAGLMMYDDEQLDVYNKLKEVVGGTSMLMVTGIAIPMDLVLTSTKEMLYCVTGAITVMV